MIPTCQDGPYLSRRFLLVKMIPSCQDDSRLSRRFLLVKTLPTCQDDSYLSRRFLFVRKTPVCQDDLSWSKRLHNGTTRFPLQQQSRKTDVKLEWCPTSTMEQESTNEKGPRASHPLPSSLKLRFFSTTKSCCSQLLPNGLYYSSF